MEITKILLKQKFEEYNKLYFNNELPMCRFTYTYMRDVYGRYMTSTTPKGKKIGHIWISKSIVFFDGFFCHGRHFVRQVKRIKKQYGLDIWICSPHWHYRNEKPHTSRSTEFIGFLRNRLHLF